MDVFAKLLVGSDHDARGAIGRGDELDPLRFEGSRQFLQRRSSQTLKTSRQLDFGNRLTRHACLFRKSLNGPAQSCSGSAYLRWNEHLTAFKLNIMLI